MSIHCSFEKQVYPENSKNDRLKNEGFWQEPFFWYAHWKEPVMFQKDSIIFCHFESVILWKEPVICLIRSRQNASHISKRAYHFVKKSLSFLSLSFLSLSFPIETLFLFGKNEPVIFPKEPIILWKRACHFWACHFISYWNPILVGAIIFGCTTSTANTEPLNTQRILPLDLCVKMCICVCACECVCVCVFVYVCLWV